MFCNIMTETLEHFKLTSIFYITKNTNIPKAAAFQPSAAKQQEVKLRFFSVQISRVSLARHELRSIVNNQYY